MQLFKDDFLVSRKLFQLKQQQMLRHLIYKIHKTERFLLKFTLFTMHTKINRL